MNVKEHCGTLWDIMEALQSITEPLRKHYVTLRSRYGTLQKVTEHYGVLRDVTEALQVLTERYGSVAEALWSVAEHYRAITCNGFVTHYETIASVTAHYKTL